MRPFHFWILTVSCWLLAFTAVPAQTRKSAQQKARTAQVQKTKAKSQPAKAKSQQAKGKSKIQPAKGKPQQAKGKGQNTKAKTPQGPTVKGLQSQRQLLQKQIKEQELKLQANRKDVKKRLENLQMINTEIADKRRTIDTIRHDLNILDGNIATLDIQLKTLEQKLTERKQNYMKSMRYMHRNRSLQNQLMFIFSAQNFTQMYRRMRFTREYAQYQRAQGEAVMIMQEQVEQAKKELSSTKQQKSTLLDRDEQERKDLEGKQAEQQQVVNTLQKEQKTIQGLIDEQRKKDAALNAQIEKLIAEEVARAKARAEAEAKRKAAEEAAKKRAAELARKKAAAEAAARENARRIAEAKAREERAKQEALAAAKKSEDEKKAAEQAAREAEQARRAAERKAAEDAKAHEHEMAEAQRKSLRETPKVEKSSFKSSNTVADRHLSGSFESNRGRLPMPISGKYRIVSGFGQNDVEGLKGVRLDNKGINIKGDAGAQVRSIFDGEVCAVFNISGIMGVMVRHGRYISVYSNLSSVSVQRGQRVSTRQALGSVGSDGILKFQLRNGSDPQNPSRWLAR